MNFVNEFREKRNGFGEVVAFCHVTCRYFDRFLLQGVDKNWRQACFFYLAPGLICEGYWQVNSRRSIFRIADPTLGDRMGTHAKPRALRLQRNSPCTQTDSPAVFRSDATKWSEWFSGQYRQFRYLVLLDIPIPSTIKLSSSYVLHYPPASRYA